jgi:ABC-type transport system involved in multi-copper enzyme maturation permease subunit
MKSKLLKIYSITTLLLLLDSLAYYTKRISLIGYYSDIILFWIWLCLSLTVIVVYWKRIFAKILLCGFLFALIGSILPMMLPFYTMLLSMSSMGLKISKDLNKNFRAQIVGYSVLGHPWLEIIEKKGGLEKRIIVCLENEINDENSDFRIGDAKDILFNQESDKTLSLALFYGGPNRLITFDKTTGRIIKNHNLPY